MLNLQSLQNLAGGQRTIVAALQASLDKHNAKVAAVEGDDTYSQEHIARTIKEARETAMPKVREQLTELRQGAAVAKKQREYWSSRPLLLHKIPFHSDAATDAAMRLRYAGELAAMDVPLLLLTMDNALDEKNLALAYACVLASRPKGGDAKLFDLSQVDIPGQAAALALLDECGQCEAQGELIESAMSGITMDPVRKLQVAHRAQPNRPTSHNSR